jgi:hypothetical protein
MALITAIVTGLSLATSLVMACFSKFWKINVTEQEHERKQQGRVVHGIPLTSIGGLTSLQHVWIWEQ